MPFWPYGVRAEDVLLMNADGMLWEIGADVLAGLEMDIEGASDPQIAITSSVIPARRLVEPTATLHSSLGSLLTSRMRCLGRWFYLSLFKKLQLIHSSASEK